LVEEAAAIQKQISTPVIGVGGIETGEFIDDLISNQTIQLAAVGRAILKNPQEWANQNLVQLTSETFIERKTLAV
jgi:NADPH2 dehydrogenase